MSRIRFGLTAALSAMALAACASSNAPVANTGNSPATGSSPTASPSSQQTSVPTTTDPCQVVPASEASTLAGGSFPAGRAETTPGGGKLCIYGYQTLNVFEVLVGQAPDAATAQAEWAQEEAKAQTALKGAASKVPGLNVSISVSDVPISGADRAAVGTFSTTYAGHTFSASAIYLLKGAIFLSFSDLVVGQAAPTSAAMQAEAVTALGRLP